MICRTRLKNSVYNWRVTAFGVGLAILLNALPLLEPCGNAGTAFAQQPETANSSQGENDARPLEAGKPIERELAGGQKHYYKIALEAGQYLHLLVDQRSIDVIVTLFGPDDKQIIKMDSPIGTQGSEPVFAITETSGTYRLEVRSPDKNAPAGRYEVKIADLRMATPQDRKRVLAESSFAEGMDLESKMTAESRRKAIAKHEEALGLFRVADDSQGEGATLHRLGSIYYSLGDTRKALDYLNQALPLRRVAGDRRGEADTLDRIGSVYNALGEKQKALEYYNQSLPLKVAIGNRGSEALTLNNLGLVYYSLGETQKALDYYNQALPLSRAVGDRRGEAYTLNALGLVYNLLGAKQKALDYYNQTLSLMRTEGKLLDAHNTIESALKILDSLRTKVVSPELRSSYLEASKKYYEFNIDLLMRLHKLRPDEGYDRAALLTAERARARSLLERLAEARLEIRSGADPALVERERSLRQMLNAKTKHPLYIQQQLEEKSNMNMKRKILWLTMFSLALLTVIAIIGGAKLSARAKQTPANPSAESAQGDQKKARPLADKIDPKILAIMRRQEALQPAINALYEAAMKSPDSGFTSIAFEGDGLALYWKGPMNNDMLAAVNEARNVGPVEIIPAAFSLAEMEAEAAKIDKAMKKNGGSDIQMVTTRFDGSGLDIERMPFRAAENMALARSRVGQRSLRSAEQVLADLDLRMPIRVTTADEPIEFKSRTNDSPPWNSGGYWESRRNGQVRGYAPQDLE